MEWCLIIRDSFPNSSFSSKREEIFTTHDAAPQPAIAVVAAPDA
jgi:hypothetical protein